MSNPASEQTYVNIVLAGAAGLRTSGNCLPNAYVRKSAWLGFLSLAQGAVQHDKHRVSFLRRQIQRSHDAMDRRPRCIEQRAIIARQFIAKRRRDA